MKSELEVAQILLSFDTTFRPYEVTVADTSLWRLVRGSAGRALRDFPMPRSSLSRGEFFFSGLRSLYRLLYFSKTKASYAVRSYTSALRIPGKDGFEDIYFEKLLQSNPSGIRIYSSNAANYGNRRHGLQTETLDCTFIYIAAALMARLRPFSTELRAYEELSSLIVQHLNLPEFTPRYLARVYSVFRWESRIYETLLRTTKLQTIIAADNSERALIGACLRLNIQFIELQHGIYNPSDPDCLPSIALDQVDGDSLLLPNAVAQFGAYWAEVHRDTALGKLGRLSPVGSSIVERYFNYRKESFQPRRQCPRLLVTTQGLDRAGLIEFLQKFLDLYLAECILTIKLHPAFDQLEGLYRDALGSDQRVDILNGDAEPNTYELLACADLHLSIASACHFDALGIGTPTAVLNLKGSDAVMDLVHNGHALYIRSPAELAAIITKQSWGVVDQSISDRYFKPGYLSNMLQLMR